MLELDNFTTPIVKRWPGGIVGLPKYSQQANFAGNQDLYILGKV